ncbi:hypothetical protein S40288_11554 [Stachybotrys chartarum IBT 40288]|nr:hypothetical protein S40288_11554 [Stachybotrys chartarum IBT 40288]
MLRLTLLAALWLTCPRGLGNMLDNTNTGVEWSYSLPKTDRTAIGTAADEDQSVIQTSFFPPWTYVHLIKAAEVGDEQRVATVLAAGVKPWEEDPGQFVESRPLALAIKYGHLGCVRLLIEAGVDPTLYMFGHVDETDYATDRPLTLAIKYRQLAVVEYLLSLGRATILIGDQYGTATVADIAASQGSLPSLEMIMQYPRYGLLDRYNSSFAKFEASRLLRHAIVSGSCPVIRYAIEVLRIPADSGDQETWKGDRISIEQRHVLFEALMVALDQARMEPIRLLMSYFMRDERGVFPDAYRLDKERLADGRFHAVYQTDDVEAFKFLLDLDSQRRAATRDDIDGFDTQHMILCLQWAVMSGNSKIIRYLVEHHKLPVDVRPKMHTEPPGSRVGVLGRSALQIAVESGHMSIAQYFLEKCNAGFHDAGIMYLRVALDQADENMIRLLLKHGAHLIGGGQGNEDVSRQKDMVIQILRDEGMGIVKFGWKRSYYVEHGDSMKKQTEDAEMRLEVGEDEEWWDRIAG